MSRRRWTLARAGALTLAVALLSPVDPVVLLAVPAALVVLAFRRGTPLAPAAAVLVLAWLFRDVVGDPDPLWTAVRGWSLLLGGAFVAVTAARRRWSPVGRGLAAVGVAGALTALAGWLRPGLLAELDWWVQRELSGAALAAQRWLPEAVAGAADAWTLSVAQGWRETLHPALLGFASLASLVVGGWAAGRLAGEDVALGAFRDFRFSDHLAWGLAAGVAALLAAPVGEPLGRLGANAVAFVGGLYLLRGVAILYCVGRAAARTAWSAALWIAAGVLLYPIALAAALLLGLGDTWTDVRGRLTGRLAARRAGRS